VHSQARTPALQRLRSPLLIGIRCGCPLKSPLSSTKRRQRRRLKDHPPRQPGDHHRADPRPAAQMHDPLDAASRESSTITPQNPRLVTSSRSASGRFQIIPLSGGVRQCSARIMSVTVALTGAKPQPLLTVASGQDRAASLPRYTWRRLGPSEQDQGGSAADFLTPSVRDTRSPSAH
jgi:hypothetical protein